MKVRANADTPLDARTARNFGAEGIGLCRTEHMFFDEERIAAMREMILAVDARARENGARQAAPLPARRLRRHLPRDERAAGHDPPARSAAARVSCRTNRRSSSSSPRRWRRRSRSSKKRSEELHEFNPMLGHRGCRLAITYPEIYAMQVRAILEAACDVAGRGRRGAARDHDPARDDARRARSHARDRRPGRARGVRASAGARSPFSFGTMIELPRAALLADELARGRRVLLVRHQRSHADHDGPLARRRRQVPCRRTSRGASSRPIRSSRSTSPGVGALVSHGLRARRAPQARASSSASAASTAAIRRRSASSTQQKLDYVSCSPFRVPIARLAAAQAALSRRPPTRRHDSSGSGSWSMQG